MTLANDNKAGYMCDSNIFFIFNNIFTKERVHIGTCHENMIFSSLIEHNDICKTSYLVDLKAHVTNVTLINTAFHLNANTGSYICQVKQPLAIINGYIHKISMRWTENKELYKLMSNARQILIGEPLADLSPIKQGYLIALLRKRRTGAVVNPFYGLTEQWQLLMDTEDAFKSAPVNVHVNLINIGLLHYFDVNKYLLLAVTDESWETVRHIMAYYGYSAHINKTVKQTLKVKVDSSINVPLDVMEWIKHDGPLTLNFKRSLIT